MDDILIFGPHKSARHEVFQPPSKTIQNARSRLSKDIPWTQHYSTREWIHLNQLKWIHRSHTRSLSHE